MVLSVIPVRGARAAVVKALESRRGRQALLRSLYVVVSVISCTGPLWLRDPLAAVSPLAVSLSFCAACLFLRDDLGEDGPTARLVTVAGLLWPANYLFVWNNPTISFFSTIGSSLFWVAIAWAFLLYPRRHLDLIEQGYVVALLFGLLFTDLNIYLQTQKGFDGYPDFLGYLDGALALAAAVLAVRRFLYLRGLGRSIIIPIFTAGLVLAISSGLSWWVFFGNAIYTARANWDTIERVYSIQGWALLIVPLAFMYVEFKGKLIQAAVADELARLSYNASIEQVRDALRSALGDERLDIFFWAPKLNSYINQSGCPVDKLPTSSDHVEVNLRTPEGEKLGILIADSELAREVNLIGNVVNTRRAPLLPAWLQSARRAEQDQSRALHLSLERALWTQRENFGRDLHDGIQVRLSALKFPLKKLKRQVGDSPLAGAVDEIANQLNSIAEDLRLLSHGIAPALLRDKGLRAAVKSIVERMDIGITVSITAERFSADVERIAYNVIAEALNNAIKHASAKLVQVLGSKHDSFLEIRIIDDGVGGADMEREGCTGLAGIRARVMSVRGEFRITSPVDGGTELLVSIPCEL